MQTVPGKKVILSTKKLVLPTISAAVLLATTFAALANEAPKVVASILPVHALVAGVMEGVGTPALIIKGYGSPHSYHLRPSAAAILEKAEVVFWISEYMETSLRKPLSTLGRNAHVVQLKETEDLTLLRNRKGGTWETQHHDDKAKRKHDEHERYPDELDAHIWLDPANAKRIVGEIVRQLSKVDPANAAAYESNGKRLMRRIDALDRALEKRLRPVRDKPYVVFHDAYQYLEAYYGLNAVGSLTVSPDRRPGARRVKQLRSKIKKLGARCMFGEPQFEPSLIETIIEGMDTSRGVLDPLGASFKPGPDAYFKMMEANATAISQCLSN